jgi:hypothetical protein
MAPEGKGCSVELISDQLPSPGTQRIMAKGNFSILCGADEKSAEQKNLSLAKDQKLSAGPIPMTISRVDDKAWGEFKMSVTFAYDQNDAAIKKMIFTDASGKEIKSDAGGHSSFSFGPVTKYDVTYRLAQKVDPVNVKVIYFDKVDKVTVPIDVDTGVGF